MYIKIYLIQQSLYVENKMFKKKTKYKKNKIHVYIYICTYIVVLFDLIQNTIRR